MRNAGAVVAIRRAIPLGPVVGESVGGDIDVGVAQGSRIEP